MSFRHKTETAKILPRRSRLPAGTILNRAGQPVQALVAPSGSSSFGDRLNRLNAWREELNPLRGLTISRAISLLEDYQAGRMADLQWTWFFAEQTDPDMIALLALRIGRIVEMDYNLDPEEGADKTLAQEQTDYLTEKFSAIDNLYEGIEHLAMAPFRGYAHVEKHENNDGDIYHLEPVDQWNVVRDGMKGPWKYNPTARSADYLSLTGTPDLPMERFLYRQCPRPINRYALIKFVRSGLNEKDWDAFNEIFNVPGGVVTGPPEVPEGDEEEYESAARRVAEGGSGYLPHGSTYTPNEMPHDPQTFKLRLDWLSEKLVLAGTGGKLTMLTESGSGTLAGGAHSQVFDRIASAEAKRISEIVNKGLTTPWLEAGFPGQEQLVYFCLAANEETDAGAAVEQVSKLSIAGFQCDPEQVTQKTGWKVTLKPAPAIAPGADSPATEPADPRYLANRRIRNSAAAAAAQVRFDANAKRRLTNADRARLGPLQEHVTALQSAATPEAYAAALAKLEAAMPELEHGLAGASADLVAAWEEAFASAFANGAADAAKIRPQKPAKNALGAT